MNKEYVEIKAGIANRIIIKSEEDVEKLRNHGLIIIDVTDREPKVQNGDIYDEVNDVFISS